MQKHKDSILMIASGMKNRKKEFMNGDVESVYLNYGLLGLATLLYDRGYSGVRMFQGDSKSVREVFQEISDEGINIESLSYPVFLSIPSFFALSWAEEFIGALKTKNQEVQIIAGGRWTVDNNLEWIKRKLPLVDFVCRGCPDEYIEELLDSNNWKKHEKQGEAKTSFSKLNYTLLHHYKKYQPSIELCRGCGRGCAFCLEGKYKLTKTKTPLEVIKEAKAICEQYEDENLNFYFEASMFNPTLEWAEEFKRYYDELKMKFKWRFETRVDVVRPEVIEILAHAGLKVIDLGLESASIQQLERMEKTKNPLAYLQKTHELLEKAYQCDVWCKLNILLYAGETEETINETKKWLNQNKFKGLSVNPFILYLNGEGTEVYIERLEKITQKKIDTEQLYEKGYLFIDLSNEITSQVAKDKCKEIADKYMKKEDYLDLKRVCYTQRV